MKNKHVTFSLVLGLFVGVTYSALGQTEQRRPDRERPSVEQILADLDTDEDGRLSKEEVRGPLKKDFAQIDTDEDGFITEAELKKAPKPERRRPENGRQP